MVKKNNVNNVTVDGVARYDFPYFVPIEDGDEATVKHYKKHDVPVANIALPGRKKRYYAVNIYVIHDLQTFVLEIRFVFLRMKLMMVEVSEHIMMSTMSLK